MHPAFTRTEHRPWPAPTRKWWGRQIWLDLLFAHWPMPKEALVPLVPPGVTIQEFDGTSWIGIVPFRMEGVSLRSFPDLPWLSAFPEMNVRIYVEAEGKPGVWFLSLDASNPFAVWAARRLFHLPYYRSKMHINRTAEGYSYFCQRKSRPERFVAQYQPIGEQYESKPGSLEHWLTERYCLYASAPDGRLLRNEVHHHPWPLHKAKLEIKANTMLAAYGLPPLDAAPLLHFAPRLDVVVWDADEVSS